MSLEVSVRDPLHPVDFDLDVATVGERVWNLVNRLFMNLHTVDGQARSSVEFLVANVTFEMFRFLMLN